MRRLLLVGTACALLASAIAGRGDGLYVPAPSWAYGISSLGTGVATALGINIGSAGAPVTFNGALGTPSSGTATNITGLPVAGITGLGTGIGTSLGVNVGSAGAPVINGGALGTPSSGTLSSASGLPISTGVSGLGTGVATALGVNVGSAGAPVTFNGALGTPSSGTATSITGLPITTGTTGAAWSQTTPVPAASSGTFTTASSTVRTVLFGGKIAIVAVAATVTTVGTGSTSLTVAVPTASVAVQACTAINTSNGAINMVAQIGGSTVTIVPTAGTFTSGNIYLAFCVYEAS